MTSRSPTVPTPSPSARTAPGTPRLPTAAAQANAYNGTGDYALADGNLAYADAGGATGANYDTAIDIGNNSAPDTGAYAGADFGGGGSNDLAYTLGDNSIAGAGGDGAGGSFIGNNDVAAVFNPFGTAGSEAYAGAGLGTPGDFDLSAVFGDSLFSEGATGGNYLIEILPSLF